jgi:hypothetical protein
MQLKTLCGRPLLHGSWGRLISGWIYDVWLDVAASRVAAFEICESDRMQFHCVAPSTLRRSRNLGFRLDIDPECWTQLDRAPGWTSVRSLEAVTVVSPDGEWSCVLTDVDCDPKTWRLLHFRVDRPRWLIFGQRTLPTDRIIKSGADVIIVDD